MRPDTHIPRDVAEPPIEAREVRGISLKLLIVLISGIITIEATILGCFYAFKSEISQNTKDNVRQDAIISQIQVEQDRISKHDIKQDGDMDRIRDRVENYQNNQKQQ